ANRGAQDGGALSVGVNVELPHEQRLNEYLDIGLRMRHFFARKLLFVRYASAFVMCPGGFGTLDEMFEVLTLLQTSTVRHMPVVLLGRGEWDGLVEWLREGALVDGRIDRTDLEAVALARQPAEVVAVVQAGRALHVAHGRGQPRRRA
ncbi:MAG: LOG family protein, partial [Solirubrobacteraceae bacterium]